MSRRADLMLAIAVLLVAMLALAIFLDDRSADRRAGLRQQQLDQVAATRAGCARSLIDRGEGIQRDMDIADFARSAARKNRQVGGRPELAAAVRYEQIAARAERREQSAGSRLLGADITELAQRSSTGQLTPGARDEARRACARAFPLP